MLLSTILNKPMILAIVALSGLSISLFGYSYYSHKKNIKLSQQLNLTEAALNNLNTAVKKERLLHKETLTALEQRESSQSSQNIRYAQRIEQLRTALEEEADECLSKPIPSTIINTLKRVQTVPNNN